MNKKKLYYPLVLCCIIISVSCKKLADAVVPEQEIILEDLQLSVPPIFFADSSIEIPAGTFTAYINVDSTIRSNTNGVFGIDALSYIKVKEINLTVPDADANNNLSAFKSFRIVLSSDTNPAPLAIALVNIPAWAVNSYTSSNEDSPDISSYVQGHFISYTVFVKIRSTTSKALTIKAKVAAVAN